MAGKKSTRKAKAGKRAVRALRDDVDLEVDGDLETLDSRETNEQAIIARANADGEARRRYEREDEAKALEWCRREWGSLGGPHDPTFDVMLAKGGPLALLMRADLTTQDGAEHFFHTHTTRDGSRPSLEQLRMARAVAKGLELAILGGEDANAWELVGRAHTALFAKQDALRGVVSILTDLRQYHERETRIADRRASNGRAPLRPHPGTGTEFRASRALEQLANLDSRFARVQMGELVALVRDDKFSPIGIAVQLTAKCGAFGYELRGNDGDKAESRTKHIRDAYDKAERARSRATESPPE